MQSLPALLAIKEPAHVNLSIRNIEPEIKVKLRLAAAAHGRSMEEEVRCILRSVLSQPAAATGLGSRLHARFAAIGGVDLPLPERTERARAADFGDAGVEASC